MLSFAKNRSGFSGLGNAGMVGPDDPPWKFANSSAA